MLLTLPYFAPSNALLAYGAQPIIQALKSTTAPPEPQPVREATGQRWTWAVAMTP